MSKLQVFDTKGAPTGELVVDDALLVLNRGDQAVHDAVVALLAGRRSGTASTLRKGEVAGSNKKPWRQKGTGRARAGYRQSPIWRGGGVAFGPHPRSFALKLNRKAGQLAFRRALSEKIKNGGVRVLEAVVMPEAKTKAFAALLKSLGIAGPVLFVMDKIERNIAMAARNVPDVELTRAKDVNVYQILRYPLMVVNKAGMEDLKTRLGNTAEKGAG